MKTLLVLLGPTAVGKTEHSISIAQKLKSPIISADSRQIYKEIPIGTATPSEEDLSKVKHYFIGTKSLSDYYSASLFEEHAINVIENNLEKTDTVLMSGGSMMYIDAVCKGIDEIPNIDPYIRNKVYEIYNTEGFDKIKGELKLLDPDFYNEVDLKNTKRVIHALEICLMAGKPYSKLRKNKIKTRKFNIIKIGLNLDRQTLYDRINNRTDKMIKDGLIEEARNVYHLKHLNSLNTVGYKELFDFFDKKYSLEFAIDKIKQHSRNYARKQLSWFNRDKSINWINASDTNIENKIINLINY